MKDYDLLLQENCTKDKIIEYMLDEIDHIPSGVTFTLSELICHWVWASFDLHTRRYVGLEFYDRVLHDLGKFVEIGAKNAQHVQQYRKK